MSIIFEANVLFQIYFLIDHRCKTQLVLTEILKNSRISWTYCRVVLGSSGCWCFLLCYNLSRKAINNHFAGSGINQNEPVRKNVTSTAWKTLLRFQCCSNANLLSCRFQSGGVLISQYHRHKNENIKASSKMYVVNYLSQCYKQCT